MKLSQKTARRRVAQLANWTLTKSVIVRDFRFKDFVEAMRFVNRLAKLAEAANHHPDIVIRYNKVRLILTTHDEGGLTEKDFRLANKINKLVN